jgi:putative copper export protein
VLVAVHLLAAGIWFGGSTALVFVGVPAVRLAEGESRSRAMRELGLRWRPLGYGALLVLAVTGVPLAQHDYDEGRSPFQTVLWVKVGLSVALVVASYVHNFVLGPRLQGQVREGRQQTARPPLVAVGYASLALTLTVPVLGAVLAHLAP